ncbi:MULTISPECIES: dihydropteroate synthase [unclassified Gordonia (in: high G+C Gram-positive bacteria)]|uniref:dihydropteroate synthase n=1 Tax=unclassified Gordonia (in: high G+C Gram-positive bacteria) TaxID=2657482 RepID=UPI0010F7C93E|nr:MULTISPECIES: dihydropteroate synthase [unclassified Gordonia (in: high G+C Gram-positive bacteria)]MBN0974064.1 dihydropteroate synthase [Gordonia sp. BP-119]MBN0983879.1 dihydropteroate synthase [Gordonia sp. BP-94]
MGVLNVTADSFSDGGRYLDADAAIAHGLELIEQGADLIDVGGESTRPGAVRVDPGLEAERVVPVIGELAARGVTVSVDTMRAPVAAAAIRAGAAIVNDVSGGRADADMARVVADAGLPWILMHWRPAGDSTDRRFTHRSGDVDGYRDVVAEVSGELLAQVDAAVSAGVDADRLILDPGLGFAKTAEHNWALLNALHTITGLGFPVLVGASRKRFLGSLLRRDGADRPPAGRDVATASVSALSAAAGAWGVRVHDVASSRDAVAVAAAWRTGGSRTSSSVGDSNG